MQGAFQTNYKILIVYPIIMFISQFVTIKLFNLLNQLQDNTSVSIMLTYIITGILYTVLSYFISYIELIPMNFRIFLGISTYIIGIAITIVNVIFINILQKKKVIG